MIYFFAILILSDRSKTTRTQQIEEKTPLTNRPTLVVHPGALGVRAAPAGLALPLVDDGGDLVPLLVQLRLLVLSALDQDEASIYYRP